jgi:hypothetical protein
LQQILKSFWLKAQDHFCQAAEETLIFVLESHEFLSEVVRDLEEAVLLAYQSAKQLCKTLDFAV